MIEREDRTLYSHNTTSFLGLLSHQPSAVYNYEDTYGLRHLLWMAQVRATYGNNIHISAPTSTTNILFLWVWTTEDKSSLQGYLQYYVAMDTMKSLV